MQNKLKYLKLFESVVDKEDIENIFTDVSDLGASISISDGWTTESFLPNLNTYKRRNDEDDEEDEDEEQYQYDIRTNSNLIFMCPRKGLTSTYKIYITAKRCNSDQILNIFEELKTSIDRLSEIGQSWSSYNLINNTFRATVWIKTKEMATTDIREYLKKYMTHLGIKFRELEGPPGPNSPANIFLDFGSNLSEEEKEIMKPKKHKFSLVDNTFNLPGSKQKIVSKKVVDYCNDLRNQISQKLNIPIHGIRIRPHTNFERIELSLSDHIY